MSEATVKQSINAGIARIVLSRPQKRNALTRSFIEELAESIRAAADNQSVRLLVLAAEGPVFCAGMDLGEMQKRATQPDAKQQWQTDTQAYRDLLAEIVTLPLPTLAVVQGPALAGGCGLVLACDMVLASETAFFALPEPKRGITAAVVAPLLIHRIGLGPASYLLLSGRNIPASQAQQIGLCHEVVVDDELSARYDDLTKSILSGAPQALAITKQLLLDSAAGSLLEQLNAGMTVSAKARETNNAREGLAAFLEKRKPAWSSDTEVP